MVFEHIFVSLTLNIFTDKKLRNNENNSTLKLLKIK